MSEILTNKVTPANLKGNTVTLGNSGDTIALGVGATSTGFGNLNIIKNPANPAIDTNPADGVGTLWLNTTNGCLFSCTDATTDANEWINIANCGADNIPDSGPQDAFLVGGARGGVTNPNIINYAFASSTESVHGLSFHGVNNGSGIDGGASNSSATDGYYSTGGSVPFRTDITRFSFASTGNAVGIGNTDRHRTATEQGTNSSTHGYIHGGRGFNVVGNLSSCIKFQFAESSTSSSQVFDLGGLGRSNYGTHSTPTNGYIYGGNTGVEASAAIISTSHEFLFSNDTTRVDIQDMNENSAGTCCVGNNTNSYLAGGTAGSGVNFTRIDTHLLSSSASFTSHGDLNNSVNGSKGASTNNSGILLGGNGTPAQQAKKQTFSYASNVLANNLADFAAAYEGAGACQTPASF